MIWILAFRHLLVRRVRAFFLLLGFAVGVATMIVLLSVGQAMLAQSRDVVLVGGGDLTVLPQGVDLEALRSGALTSLFFGIDRARFVHRQMLAGPRQRHLVSAVSPGLEDKLLYLWAADRVLAVRAGGEIPSLAARAGAGLRVRAGSWEDTAADSAWIAPSAQQLYDELDRFHRPIVRDSTWGEWHYFNVTTGPEEWWYLTYLIGGDLAGGAGGGQVLVTHRSPAGYRQYTSTVPAEAIEYSTLGPDLRIGESTVSHRSGLYFLDGEAEGDAGALRFRLTFRPERQRYFPPVELRSDGFVSGYVVPGLRASMSGQLCVAGECVELRDAPAYHDHNWGVWRDVTWEWGMGRGAEHDLLYGGVLRAGEEDGAGNPFFFALVDSLGVSQVLRFGAVTVEGERPVDGAPEVRAPERLTIVATRDRDVLRLSVEVLSAQATAMEAAGLRRYFLQMRGRFELTGTLRGAAVADSGLGFFETYVGARSTATASPGS